MVVALSTVVLAGAVAVSKHIGRLLKRQAQWSEMQENLRITADVIAADIRMSGYGYALPDASMAQWITWVSGITGRVNVVEGATSSDPDSLSLVGAFKGVIAELAWPATAGALSLKVDLSFLSLYELIGRPVLIGRMELARVTSVDFANRRLNISTDPAATSVGLKYAYEVGTPVEVIDVMTYRCNPEPGAFPGRPYLAKDSHPSWGGAEVQKMVAAGIEDMQVSQGSNTVTVTLRGRTRDPELGYADPLHGDPYRRATVVVKARPRNPRN